MWLTILVLPVIPFIYLALKLKEKMVGLRHGDELGFFLLGIPCGAILWIVIIYEIVKHIRIV